MNDSPTWSYPLTWTFGGAETDGTGRKVTLNSKGSTLENAVRWAEGELKRIYES